MKKINMIMYLSIFIYIGCASILWLTLSYASQEEDHAYRIEVNRIMEEVKDINEIENIKKQKYTYIKAVSFLSSEEQNQATIQDFYVEDATYKTLIQPWYKDAHLLGYLKFSYMNKTQFHSFILMLEGVLLVIELGILLFLGYIKQYLIKPFDQVKEIPLQLAKGHYKKDITLQKNNYLNSFLWGLGQLQDSLETTKKRQFELEKEKKQLVLSLSHDIKTPLNLIKLYGKAFEEHLYITDEQRKQVMQRIIEKANDIEIYVDDIIKSAKEDIVDLQVVKGEFYVKELMDRVLAIYAPQCVQRSITLHVEDFENRILKGDIERSQEVFENLFENIFKYGDGKEIRISFYEEEYCQLIKIFNTGIPVSDNEFPHIFDSFFRSSNASGKSGSGLGLYICKELMRKMDGTIFAQKTDDGMAFILVFS